MMPILKLNQMYIILTTILVIAEAGQEVKSENERVLTTQEVNTNKLNAIDQQTEEKPFESKEINVVTFRNGSFANVSNCLYFYQRGGSVKLHTLMNKNRSEQIHHLWFGHETLKNRGKCFKNVTTHEVYISLTFKLMNDTTSSGTLKINMTIIKKNTLDSWQVKSMHAKLKELNKEFKFNSKHLEAPIEFSYSCKAFSINSANENDKLILKLNNLQIQPFYTNKVFAESFDCSTFFTLGTWMGLIVMWIFTILVALGAYSLLSIKTMDQFDNVKGKSIINVAATDQ